MDCVTCLHLRRHCLSCSRRQVLGLIQTLSLFVSFHVLFLAWIRSHHFIMKFCYKRMNRASGNEHALSRKYAKSWKSESLMHGLA
jgi:hypothetical protein